MSGTSQFVGITDKKIDPKAGVIQNFDQTARETEAERATNKLEEHRSSGSVAGKPGAKNVLGK